MESDSYVCEATNQIDARAARLVSDPARIAQDWADYVLKAEGKRQSLRSVCQQINDNEIMEVISELLRILKQSDNSQLVQEVIEVIKSLNLPIET